MNVTDSTTTAATTAERAYFIYLERQRLGLPGNEHDDWIRAEAGCQHQHIPLTTIKGIGPRVADQLAAWELSDFGERLPRLTARAKSGQWIEQARKLS